MYIVSVLCNYTLPLSQNHLQNYGISSVESEFVKSLDSDNVVSTFSNENVSDIELCMDEENKRVATKTVD